MEHRDHVNLINKGVNKGGIWADLGSGTGAFTLALRDLAGPEVEIFSVDKSNFALNQQQQNFDRQFPDSNIHFLNTDFTQTIQLPPLDGILMANSLHYIPDKSLLLTQLKTHLKSQGTFLLVEYNTSKGNQWVPYPLTFEKFDRLAQITGYQPAVLLHTVPSQFLDQIYSAKTSILSA